MKLICVLPEERIVGLHVLGLGADEMLQGFSVAVVAGATKKQFDSTVAIHPTSAEEFVTMNWGMSAEAEAQYGADNIKVYQSKFTNMYYSMTTRKPKTYMKLICVLPEERIVGLHVLGLGADEMLQGFSIAVVAGATKKQFDSTVAIHPTSAEEFVTMNWGMSL
eukprot:sb/3472583/